MEKLGCSETFDRVSMLNIPTSNVKIISESLHTFEAKGKLSFDGITGIKTCPMMSLSLFLMVSSA